jgi:hypothetical protein
MQKQVNAVLAYPSVHPKVFRVNGPQSMLHSVSFTSHTSFPQQFGCIVLEHSPVLVLQVSMEHFEASILAGKITDLDVHMDSRVLTVFPSLQSASVVQVTFGTTSHGSTHWPRVDTCSHIV